MFDLNLHSKEKKLVFIMSSCILGRTKDYNVVSCVTIGLACCQHIQKCGYNISKAKKNTRLGGFSPNHFNF